MSMCLNYYDLTYLKNKEVIERVGNLMAEKKLGKYVDINAQGDEGNIALHYALKLCHGNKIRMEKQILGILFDFSGIEIDITNIQGESVLEMIHITKKKSLIKMLNRHQAKMGIVSEYIDIC